MLEFQEGFFEQEVREGFYLDATMKTVWAAELEVLQRVAEVCGRHGIQWYAAYGTLMGAIRHEGFVPWDDDMDIWVMRKDYNRLMTELLPKELPEGYIVQSALNESGYDQFHSCVINGSGIDITPDRLAEYHGCPFTVCLDIFPLDYLPRNEGEREIQKNLVELAGRAAMLAKELNRGDYDEKDEKSSNNGTEKQGKKYNKRKQGVIGEVMTAIEYLENFCSFRLDRKYIEKNDWRKVASELWRCANYVAMMYGEEDADYIVEYLDFDRWEHKKFPKEWFAETYSATFENFMVPIPSGYHQLLYTIYGDYWRYVMKAGCHEYPFYLRQLRELRGFVANSEKKLAESGLVQHKEEGREEVDFQRNYKVVMQHQGIHKVLVANDPALYMENPETQLERLVSILEFFKNHTEELTLWWRPHPVMQTILNSDYEKYGKRYEGLLAKYKNEGWGICDETDDINRAVEECDIYYGEMNAIIQPFQNALKPVLLTPYDNKYAEYSNARRENQLRGFISYTDYCRQGTKIIFANTNYNALICADEKTKKVEKMIPFTESKRAEANLHMRVVSDGGKCLFAPVGSGNAHIYDVETEQMYVKNYWSEKKVLQDTWDIHYDGQVYYLLPSATQLGLWIWRPQNDSIEQEEWWNPGFGEGTLIHGSMGKEKFYTLERNTNKLAITDLIEKKIEMYELGNDVVVDVQYDGENIWYSLERSADIVQWNTKMGFLKRVKLPMLDEYNPERHNMYYIGMHFSHNKFFLLPQMANKIYVYDILTENLICSGEYDCDQKSYNVLERAPFFKDTPRELVIMFKTMGIQVRVAYDTVKFEVAEEKYLLDSDAKVYQNSVLFDRNALLYEQAERFELSTLNKYNRE